MFYNNNHDLIDLILDEEDSEEFLEYEYDSNPINGNLNINTNGVGYYPRHNNTPHANDSNNHNSTPREFSQLIPERIRLLLDRFAINGYNTTNGAPSPANKLLIDSIPEITIDETFIHNNFTTTDLIECSICKITIHINDKIKILTCKHYFHSKCIVTWLNIHASCPLCRYRLNVNAPNNNHSGANDEDRLQNLRRRRQSRRTLRNETPSNSNSGARTPYNDHPQSSQAAAAATQLIQAVTSILDQYSTNMNEDNDQRVVRFRVDHNIHNPPRTRTRTPHSSRSNTKTRNSLPELPLLLPLSPKHSKNHSSPPSMHANANPPTEDEEVCTESDHNDEFEPISASKTQRDFCKWNSKRRRSRLDSNNNNNGHTIIYNSNYNQNYIYNNNYNCEEEDKKVNLKSNATTPSPAPPPPRHSNYNNKLPAYNTPMGTEFSNQTVLIKNGTFSGQTSPNIYEEQTPIEELFNFSNENTPAPVVHAGGNNIYAFMSAEQLENAKKGHKNVINKHQLIVEQIQAEKNKRMLRWKCPECLKNERSFMFLPCRHLGLCQKCNLQKISKIMKCSTCHCAIRQKIPINFSND